MMQMYINDTLIPKMLEVMPNDTTKDKPQEKHGLTTLCQDTVGEWLIKLGFKYNYSVKNYYVDSHEKKDTIWYRWNFIDQYLLLEKCMFRWIQITADEPEQYEGYEK